MARVVSAATSAFFEAHHRANGVRLHLGAEAPEIDTATTGRITVSCINSLILSGDMLLVGIGATPDVALAQAAGLAVERGVVVDGRLLSADSAVSAIGDCADFPGPDGQRLCLASVQNAVDQAKFVAARIMGAAETYHAVPWFWSDQGADKLQIAGLGDGVDQDIARVDPDGRALSVLRFRHGRLIALETANRPGEHMLARKLLATGSPPSFDELQTCGFDLRALAASGRQTTDENNHNRTAAKEVTA
jgi:3-phenylpropionate/trans-cinnamate dioxygenase ferredoxin reductase component